MEDTYGNLVSSLAEANDKRICLLVMDGVELHIEPYRAGLSPEQLRAFCRGVTKLLDNITKDAEESEHENRSR